jgi:hypothetical protein
VYDEQAVRKKKQERNKRKVAENCRPIHHPAFSGVGVENSTICIASNNVLSVKKSSPFQFHLQSFFSSQLTIGTMD